MPQLLVITLRGRLVESIDEVTPEGRRHVTQKWSFDPLEFNGMAVPLDQIPRQVESQALRSPDGEIEALDRSAVESDLLAWVARSIGGFVPRLPDHPVPAGETWSRTATLAAGGGAEFLQTATGTFTGMEDATALLSTTGGLALTRTAAGLDAFDLDFSGKTKFATEDGYVAESKQDGTLSCKSRTGKSPLTIRARFTSILTAQK
jgi:hypothetical protein